MTEAVWTAKILKFSSSLADRRAMGDELLKSPDGVIYCLHFIFEATNKERVTKSAFALDQAVRSDLDILKPHKTRFFKALCVIETDLVKRIFAKTLELISFAFLKGSFPLQKPEQELMVSTCFDWLIAPEKVAVKVFAMQCLYNLRNAQNWIIPELTAQLEQQFSEAGPAFQSRARHILKKLKN